MVSGWNEWTSEEKATQLAMSLTGIARQAWSDSWGSADLDYDSLVQVMNSRFKPEGQEEAFKAEFCSRQKQAKESYADFGHALRRLAMRAFPKFQYEAREDLIIDQFIYCLEGEMKRHIKLAHPNSLEKAVTMAIEFDAVSTGLKSPTVPTKPKVVAAVKSEDSGELGKVISNLAEKVEALANFRSRRRVPLAEMECFGCHKKGHIRINCPDKNKTKSSEN